MPLWLDGHRFRVAVTASRPLAYENLSGLPRRSTSTVEKLWPHLCAGQAGLLLTGSLEDACADSSGNECLGRRHSCSSTLSASSAPATPARATLAMGTTNAPDASRRLPQRTPVAPQQAGQAPLDAAEGRRRNRDMRRRCMRKEAKRCPLASRGASSLRLSTSLRVFC